MSDERDWYPLTGPVEHPGATVRANRAAAPIDPLDGPKLALAGRIVTMDGRYTVRPEGVLYIEKGCIVAVQSREQPPPTGFGEIPVVNTQGTLFPGLVELHNHLSYNALPLWAPVPKLYEHRGQWPDHPDYRKLISGPMSVIGKYTDAQGRNPYLPALVRYVELKCLLGGVTTSQGVKLFSNAGIQRFYRGIVRNVEQTGDKDLPEAQGRIPDLDARDAAAFLARLQKEDSCFLLHLSEGYTPDNATDSMARRHFLALEVAPGKWALNKTFTGIHAAGLLPADFDVLAQHEASMVWSPMSNLLLYGNTARVDAARKAGVTIGLGSDWSPTGSKNLLGELKVALLHSEHALNGLFSARDIVAMATCNAARILKWDKHLGSLRKGARADVLVIKGHTGDPYDALMKTNEEDIRLVMINGVARFGMPSIMQRLAPADQEISIGGSTRRLFLKQATADPDVAPISAAEARSRLASAFADIRDLAKEQESPRPVRAMRALDARAEPRWSLALDEVCDCGVEFAPRLPFAAPGDTSGFDRAPLRAMAAASPPLSTILQPIALDPLTVIDDPHFLDRIEQQPNVPASIRNGLRAMY